MKRFGFVLAAAVLVVTAAPTTAFSAVSRLSSVSISPQTFSPDGDGIADLATIHYRLRRPASVTIRIYRGSTIVRTLRLRRHTHAGLKTVKWNGRTGSGTTAADDTYTYRVFARWHGGKGRSKGMVIVATDPATDPTQPTPAVTEPATQPTEPATATPALPGRWIGFYVPGSPSDMTPLAAVESNVDRKAAVVNFFQSSAERFNQTKAANAVAHGAIPMATLEFWAPGAGVNQPDYSLSRIAGGAFDGYLQQYADDAKAFGHEVWLRPLHEMNGNWYPWGGTVNGNSAAQFVAAWRHIKDVLAQRGAANVKLVWCPNVDSVPNTSANSIAAYWPGDAYVDYVALDGYNFGTTKSWSSWRSFGAIFGAAYNAVTGLTSKPVFVAETASTEIGGSKAAWIADMFQSIKAKYTRIQGVCWFNANKETDWRVESSSSSLEAFRTAAAGF